MPSIFLKNKNNLLVKELSKYEQEFIELRHYFHQHPEISKCEYNTANKIETLLNSWGIPTHRMCETGIIGVIKKGMGAKNIGIRADIDALPIQDKKTEPYHSAINNAMHACGHDGHITTLLMAAKYLSLEATFEGTVTLIFQPDEEQTAGAHRMIENGLFKQFPVDAIFAFHNHPSAKAGTVLINHGPQMAGTCSIEINVCGPGGHAAHPNQTSDTVLAASHIVVALQSIISRNICATDTAVLTISSINGGSANNIIPNMISMTGTLRYFDITIRETIKNQISEIAKQTANIHGSTAEVILIDGYIPTINHPKETDFCIESIRSLIDDAYVLHNKRPSMGAEDFGFMLKEVPGCYFYLGNDSSDGIIPLHSPHYDYNDDNLLIGSAIWCQLACDFLSSKAHQNH